MHKFAELEKKFMRKIAELENKFMDQLPHEIKAKCNTGDTTSASDRLGYDDLKRERGEYRCEEHDSNHSKDDTENTWLKHVPDVRIYIFVSFSLNTENTIIQEVTI